MGDIAKVILFFANTFYALCGAALAAVGAWYFVQLYEIMVLRNVNHYYLNYQIYWVQVMPWLYVIIGLVLLLVAWCGYCAAVGKRRGTMLLYINLLIFTIICNVATTTLVFIYADGENTDKFIADTILDAFQNAKSNDEVRAGFSKIEMKYHCCGAMSPRDYIMSRPDFPMSCCDDQLLGEGVCELTNMSANMRHGCSKVASTQARRVLIYLAVASAIVGFLQLLGLVVAISLYAKPKDKRIAMLESESKKVLL